MSDTRTLEDVTRSHEQKVEQNRALGVIDYKSGQQQSERIFEVTAGRKYVPDPANPRRMKSLGPGHLFHPTASELAEDRYGRNGLRGKAREVTRSQYEAIQAARGRSSNRSAGADIGLRALPMAESTLKRALQANMTEADFEGVEPDGSDGQYTFRQVEAMIAARGTEEN